MAYQNVGTPRFYINTLEWLSSVRNILKDGYGNIVGLNDVFRTLPVTPAPVGFTSEFYVLPPGALIQKNGFLAVLGHTLSHDSFEAGYNVGFSIRNSAEGEFPRINEITNASQTGDDITPGYDGFTFITYTPNGDDISIHAPSNPIFGSIIAGNYFDMPHSPDLSLTMTREYDGIKTIETKGGASLSNSFYHSAPQWPGPTINGVATTQGAWELTYNPLDANADPNTGQGLSRSGRRIWNLSFSYLDAGDTFGSNQMLHMGRWDTDETGTDSSDTFFNGNYLYNILTDDNFFSQVIHRTNGGRLPYIFNPSGGGSNPDNNIQNYAICKFDMKSFKFQQQAPGLYRISLKIREVW